MRERGIFQRTIDNAVEYSREHKGMSASGGLIASGAAVEAKPLPGKEIIAIPMVIVGGVVGLASSFIEYYDNRILPFLRNERALNPNQESVLADFTEEGPTSS